MDDEIIEAGQTQASAEVTLRDYFAAKAMLKARVVKP